MAERSETANRSETERALIQGSTLGAGVLMALALFAMVNYLSLRHYKRFDATSSQLYSLSEKSKNVVRSLDRPIEMVMFLNPGSELYGAASELLDRYAAANPEFVKTREVDPARNLLEAQQLVQKYGIDRENVLVIASGDDRRVINEFDLAEYDYSAAQYGQAPTLQEFKGEQLITGALLALVEAKKPRVFFTSGHGEGPLTAGDPRSFSQARDLLGKDNFEIEEWSPLGKVDVPAGIDLIVVAGPTTNFLAPELELFSRYLEQGGRMLWLLDPVLSPTGEGLVDLGVGAWMAEQGVEIQDDIVIDPSSELPFYGAETLYTDAYGSHPIVEALKQTRTRVLLSLARSVTLGSTRSSATATELVHTSGEGWGETNLANLDGVGQDDDDLGGPVPLGVAVSWPIDDGASGDNGVLEGVAEEDDSADDLGLGEGGEAAGEDQSSKAEEARLVVFGDSDFATDSQVANGANGLLLLNSLNWLVKREELIEIEGRRPQQTRMTLSDAELNDIYLVVLLLMPGLAVAMGVMMYMKRRR